MPPWLMISVCLAHHSTKLEGVKKCVFSHPDEKDHCLYTLCSYFAKGWLYKSQNSDPVTIFNMQLQYYVPRKSGRIYSQKL